MRISDWSSDVCSSDLPKYFSNEKTRRAEESYVRGHRRRSRHRRVRFQPRAAPQSGARNAVPRRDDQLRRPPAIVRTRRADQGRDAVQRYPVRSEEHTSELKSLMRISYAVFCLKIKTTHTPTRLHIAH